MEEIKFKELEPSQISIIVPMMKDFYEIDGYPFDERRANENFEQFIDNPSFGKIFLIYDHHEIVGYIILTYIFSFEFGGQITFLDELFIDKKYRGKGYGKIAVDFVKTFAQKNNFMVVLLEVERHNKNASELYSARGFKKHHRDLMIYKA